MQKPIFDQNNTFDEVLKQLADQNDKVNPEYYERNSEKNVENNNERINMQSLEEIENNYRN